MTWWQCGISVGEGFKGPVCGGCWPGHDRLSPCYTSDCVSVVRRLASSTAAGHHSEHGHVLPGWWRGCASLGSGGRRCCSSSCGSWRRAWWRRTQARARVSRPCGMAPSDGELRYLACPMEGPTPWPCDMPENLKQRAKVVLQLIRLVAEGGMDPSFIHASGRHASAEGPHVGERKPHPGYVSEEAGASPGSD